jgi:CDP-paratose 2-epimerase
MRQELVFKLLLPLQYQERRKDQLHRQRWPVQQQLTDYQSRLNGFSETDLIGYLASRYFGLRTGTFRGGCLTGPGHSGTELHGFLAYLMQCTVTGTPYRVFGYKGKQVRDNIHSSDLIAAFDVFYRRPRVGEVYNIGGGRYSNCSMLEAIDLCEQIAGRELDWQLSDQARMGDHRWWISDLDQFRADYPDWALEYDLETTLREIYERNAEYWTVRA